VVNRNINFTNICYTGCRFCACAQRKGDADAYSLSAAEVADRAWEAHVAGATEVCMQGGIDPELPVTGYADLVRAVKERVPTMHVHAFSPMEVVNGASRAGLSVRDWLIALREAGLDVDPALELAAPFEPGVATEVLREFCSAQRGFDGVVCCSDVLALLTVQALRAVGRSVPGDVAVTGYDDMPLAAYCDPPLTTVHQPVAEAGAELVEALLGQLRGERAGPRTMPVYLTLRESAPHA
jgi:DNA-binding LacI/PurR family transcriptional regulator